MIRLHITLFTALCLVPSLFILSTGCFPSALPFGWFLFLTYEFHLFDSLIETWFKPSERKIRAGVRGQYSEMNELEWFEIPIRFPPAHGLYPGSVLVTIIEFFTESYLFPTYKYYAVMLSFGFGVIGMIAGSLFYKVTIMQILSAGGSLRATHEIKPRVKKLDDDAVKNGGDQDEKNNDDEEDSLILLEHGAYGFVRHPMYLAAAVWGVARHVIIFMV